MGAEADTMVLQAHARHIMAPTEAEALAVKKGALAVGLKGSKIVRYKVNDQTDLWD